MKKIMTMLLAVMISAVAAKAQSEGEEITFERKQAIDSLALEKVRDLGKYVKIVGDKNTQWSDANRVIDRAEELFMTGAEIGVSSLRTNQVRYFKVRQYFERLMRLNYDRVEIEWYNIEYVSDMQAQPDGTYVGVITVFQTFRGYDAEGELVYKDTTKKDITVYAQHKETQIGGRIIGFWDVLLGDMRVKETLNK